MKKSINEVMEMLDLDELVKVKKDLDNGGEHLNRMLKTKIKEELKRHDKFCCVCDSRIDPYSVANFTLIFGPDDMKKKASFCAIDCLEYFLKNLKDFWQDEESQAFVRNKRTQERGRSEQ